MGRGDAPPVPAAALAPAALAAASRAAAGGRARTPARSRRRAAQQLDRRLVADELGDRLAAHAAHDAGERPDDELVGARVGQPADEVAVDLQVAEGQVLEVWKEPKPAPKSSSAISQPSSSTPAQKLARASHVGDRGGLGDLDHQPRRLDAVALRSLRSRSASIERVGDRQRGEVDRDLAARARPAALPSSAATRSSTIRSISPISP